MIWLTQKKQARKSSKEHETTMGAASTCEQNPIHPITNQKIKKPKQIKAEKEKGEIPVEEKGKREKNESGQSIRIDRQNIEASALGHGHFAYNHVNGHSYDCWRHAHEGQWALNPWPLPCCCHLLRRISIKAPLQKVESLNNLQSWAT